MPLSLSHVQDIPLHVRSDHEQGLGFSPDMQALALSDREEVSAPMTSHARAVRRFVAERLGQPPERSVRRQRTITRPSGRDLDDVAVLGCELLLQENGQIDLAHEADALRVLAGSRSQMLFRSDAPDLGLEQMSDRKESARKLPLRKLAEKIALVLVRVAARKQAMNRPAFGPDLLAAAIVACRHEIGAQLESRIQKGVELDLAVAQHVGVRRAAAPVFGEHVVHHAAAVFVAQVDEMERDVEPFGGQLGEHLVVVPRAVAFERAGGVVPVAHEQSHHVVALLLEQVSRDARIHASREAYYDPFHRCMSFCFCICRSGYFPEPRGGIAIGRGIRSCTREPGSGTAIQGLSAATGTITIPPEVIRTVTGNLPGAVIYTARPPRR